MTFVSSISVTIIYHFNTWRQDMSWVLASDIAERMKDLRRVLSTGPKSSLSQEELGRRAGVRPSQVSQWERGVQQPSKSRLESWAEREGWPVTIFAEGSPSPSVALPSLTAGAETRAPTGPDGAPAPSEPDEILAKFYRLMARAAEAGIPWPAELAGVVEEMYRAAKGGHSALPHAGEPPAGEPASAGDVPGW
jgi:transcriptional regulator with XRE-family HTH domain